MRSSRSTKQRLDYSELHSTGVRKSHSELGMPPPQDASSGLVLYKSTLADIVDFMEENQLDETNVQSEDPDAIIKRLESLRTTLRVYHLELKTSNNLFEEEYGAAFQQTIQQIKEFIKHTKSVKVQAHSQSQKMKLEESYLQTKADTFQIGELQHTINRMMKEVTISVSKLSNAEVIRRERDVPEMRKRLDNICSQLKHLLSHSPSPDLHEVSKDYDQLKRIFNSYLTSIIAEYDERDIETSKTFKASSINIKLPVFNGYKSSVDIYRFQSDFEKLHAKRTPKNCLPDLLKNNYLGEPALSLVKHLDDIQEIWDRLKSSYGSPKILLQRKLNELNSINQLFRARDPERLANGLAVLITMMKDLTILSSDHGIEQHLYCSNAIERVYSIIGDLRVTRWLNISCEKELSDKQH